MAEQILNEMVELAEVDGLLYKMYDGTENTIIPLKISNPFVFFADNWENARKIAKAIGRPSWANAYLVGGEMQLDALKKGEIDYHFYAVQFYEVERKE